MKYRVKIIELNNGDLKYIPQIKTTLHPIGRKEWVKKLHFLKKWHYLRQWNMAGDISVTEDMIPGIEYDTETGALEIIETYKKKLYYKKMKEVKNITYKYL